jgi:hypothetical protein
MGMPLSACCCFSSHRFETEILVAFTGLTIFWVWVWDAVQSRFLAMNVTLSVWFTLPVEPQRVHGEDVSAEKRKKLLVSEKI